MGDESNGWREAAALTRKILKGHVSWLGLRGDAISNPNGPTHTPSPPHPTKKKNKKYISSDTSTWRYVFLLIVGSGLSPFFCAPKVPAPSRGIHALTKDNLRQSVGPPGLLGFITAAVRGFSCTLSFQRPCATIFCLNSAF